MMSVGNSSITCHNISWSAAHAVYIFFGLLRLMQIGFKVKANMVSDPVPYLIIAYRLDWFW